MTKMMVQEGKISLSMCWSHSGVQHCHVIVQHSQPVFVVQTIITIPCRSQHCMYVRERMRNSFDTQYT